MTTVGMPNPGVRRGRIAASRELTRWTPRLAPRSPRTTGGDPVTTPTDTAHARRPLLGLRQAPGRLALALFHGPLRAYRHGSGWIFGHLFLYLEHVGRRTGEPHETIAMVLAWDRSSREAIVCSAWGPHADWVRNLHARPARSVTIGRDSYTPEHRFLSDQEALLVLENCLHRHPWRFRFIAWVLGLGNLRDDSAAQDFVHTRPFIAFRPTQRPTRD